MAGSDVHWAGGDVDMLLDIDQGALADAETLPGGGDGDVKMTDAVSWLPNIVQHLTSWIYEFNGVECFQASNIYIYILYIVYIYFLIYIYIFGRTIGTML